MAAADRYSAWLFDRGRPYLGRRVLDAGAGIGTFTELAAPGRELVVALEPDPEFVPALERRFAGRDNVTVLAAEAADPRVADVAPFDSIVCFNVLEHIREDEAALASLRRLLGPGGRLLLLVPAHPALYGETDRTVFHERRYRKNDLAEKLERAGLEVDELRYVNPLGAIGWLLSSRLLRRRQIPQGPLRLYDRLVPLLRPLDRIELPLGLSLWAVARRT